MHCPTQELIMVRGCTLDETGKSVAHLSTPELDWLPSSSDLVSDDNASDGVYLPHQPSLRVLLLASDNQQPYLELPGDLESRHKQADKQASNQSTSQTTKELPQKCSVFASSASPYSTAISDPASSTKNQGSTLLAVYPHVQ